MASIFSLHEAGSTCHPVLPLVLLCVCISLLLQELRIKSVWLDGQISNTTSS